LASEPIRGHGRPALFYGWYIVGIGFLAQIACAFYLSSTLSVFLKSVTADLGVSRGMFSLMRSAEHVVYAVMAPWLGGQLDRYGARWLMVIGAVLSTFGFLLLGQIQSFWQFAATRILILSIGHAMVCYFVVNVTISRWFVRKRGRALAIANLGQGISKVTISLVVASLFSLIGWRHVWSVFGFLVIILVLIPAGLWMRRSPEDMGLYPDGAAGPVDPVLERRDRGRGRSGAAVSSDVSWKRAEVVRTTTFWLIVFVFSIVDVGIAGFNLHVVSFVSDKGYSTVLAASVMTVIAGTQVGSGLFWGFVSERVSVRKATSLMFVVQAAGLLIALQTDALAWLYSGFFFYGTGLGGAQVLQEVMWANYFGRISLGTVRGLSLPIVLVFAAAGPPFFGYLFDYTGSYELSLKLFIAVQIVSAGLTLLIRRPVKRGQGSGVRGQVRNP
jgi:OFA family oxalate/formate antiporter-like MFS transporter